MCTPAGDTTQTVAEVFNSKTLKSVFYLETSLLEKKHTGILFLRTVRSSGALTTFLGKVGHLLIMERRHLTINHESNFGTAQQKHRLSISCPGHHSKCHCLIHSWSSRVRFAVISPFQPPGAAPCRVSPLCRRERTHAAMSQSEEDCSWCKLSSLRLHQISVKPAAR